MEVVNVPANATANNVQQLSEEAILFVTVIDH